jgi:hypothetical protein
MFFGPLVGSWIQSVTSGRTCCDIFALANLVLVIVLLVFNCGPFVFRENRSFHVKLLKLQSKDKTEEVTFGFNSHYSFVNSEQGVMKQKRSESVRVKRVIMRRFEIRDTYAEKMANKIKFNRESRDVTAIQRLID